MKFTSVLNIAAAAAFAVSSVSAASNSTGGVGLATIVKDLNDIKSKAETLQQEILATDGSNVIADIGFYGSSSKLQIAIDGMTEDVGNLTVKVTSIEVQGAIYLLDLVEQSAKASLNGLIERKPQFDKAVYGAVTPIVAKTVYELHVGVDKLAVALVKIVPQAKVSTALALVSKLDADFDKAAKVFPWFGLTSSYQTQLNKSK